MGNYYNEFDPKAAAWLRQLIAEGHIPKGVVDERSIVDVQPDDLRGFVQCHFFAGIGGWPLALSLAGVSSDEPLWTGSCPCPPFSCAGKKKVCPQCSGRSLLPHPFQTGVFACCECGHEWPADERHLWPEFYRLIRQSKPATVYGEQVNGTDGEIWLSGIRACLEIEGYGVGASELCSAGVGAPNRRQRLFWVAESRQQSAGRGLPRPSESSLESREGTSNQFGRPGDSIRLPEPTRGGCGELRTEEKQGSGGHTDRSSGLGQSDSDGCRARGPSSTTTGHRDSTESAGGADVRMGSPIRTGPQRYARDGDHGDQSRRDDQESGRSTSAAGSLGLWGEFEIIDFIDGKKRRIESGLKPLAPRLPWHLVALRGYGNAINPWVAKEFIKAFRETQRPQEAVLKC